MTPALRLGFWGAGAWAKICSRSVKGLGQLQIVACFDADRAACDSLAREADCKASCTEDDFLASNSLDAVAILTPNYLHCEQTIKALERGLHVFVEKPMSNSVSESLQMVDASVKADRCLFVGHNTRRERRFRKMKELLDSGDIGSPVMATCTYTSEAGLGKRLGGWRYDRSLCPAVAVSQIGVHAIDLMQYFLGPVIAVQAWIRNVALEGGVEDVCLARLQHACGISSTFNNSYSVPRARSVEVFGTGGALHTWSEDRIFYQKTGSAESSPLPADTVDTIREEYLEFANCCFGRLKPETGGPEGFAAVAVMEAMIQSSANDGIQTSVIRLEQ